MINDNIVVVRKEEYEIMVHDAELANLTRKYLHSEDGSYGNLEFLRLIYDIPAKEEE